MVDPLGEERKQFGNAEDWPAGVDNQHLTPEEQPITKLGCKDAFELLTDREKKYAHFFSKASWYGSLIVLYQTSLEAPHIFDLLQLVFSNQSYEEVRKKQKAEKGQWPNKDKGGFEEDIYHFYQYAAQFYGNFGNYTSFGDKKFVPRISKEKFRRCLMEHGRFVKERGALDKIKKLFDGIKDRMYSLTDKCLGLGKPKEGTSTYYKGKYEITDADVEAVKEFMIKHGLEAWNSRLFKIDYKDSKEVLEIKFAGFYKREGPIKDEKFKAKDGKCYHIITTYGDYEELLFEVVYNLKQARYYTANETQDRMIEHYLDHFDCGELKAHKKSQEEWVKDIGPAVETTIGFIENYRDGYGERAEFEGMVACVDKAQSVKFQALVDQAEVLIPKLPWSDFSWSSNSKVASHKSTHFEKEVFKRPDFTALNVITFANSGIPIGINIPNYDDVREHIGFKNVHLHNVLTSRWSANQEKPVDFIRSVDQDLFKKLRMQAFEMQVGLHELLGHGSGKLIYETTKDWKKIQDPTNDLKPVSNCYKTGETYSTVFGAVSSSWEECRAEATALYLGLEEPVMDIFKFDDAEKRKEVTYISWLSMCHAGLAGTELYNPEKKKWGQAHSQARYAILQILLKAGIVEFENFKTDDMTLKMKGKTTEEAVELIQTDGKKAIGDFLCKLNVYKSTGDIQKANRLWEDLTILNADFIKAREIVMSKKRPRPVYVQASTEIDNRKDKTLLHEFTPTPQGLFLSMQYHFPHKPSKKPNTFDSTKNINGLTPESRFEDLIVQIVSVVDPNHNSVKGKGKRKGKGKGKGKKGKSPENEEPKKLYLVGDTTGCVHFEESGDFEIGGIYLLRRASIRVGDKATMILYCKTKPCQLYEYPKFTPKIENNVSAVEYQLVSD